MKFKHIIGALAIAAALVGCKKEDGPKDIICSVNPASLDLEEGVVPAQVELTATMAWKAEITYEGDDTGWLAVTPSAGNGSASSQKITITPLANTGRDRRASIKFNMSNLDDATVAVTQKGPGGSADAVYFNNFDKATAVKTGNYFPNLSDSDCWRNEKGTGIAGIEYVLDGNKATVRSNLNSTTPAFSGVNNIFFGADALFCVKGIALPEGQTNFEISFAGIRNVYGKTAGDGQSIFDHNAFKIYVSNDGTKWVNVNYVFADGDPDNTWAKAKAVIAVPAGTTTLGFGITTPTEASTYRLDDLKIDIASAAGTAVDFTTGSEIAAFNGGSSTEEGTPQGEGTKASPYNATKALQVAKALSKTDTTDFVYVHGYICGTPKAPSVDTGTFGNATFYIVDEKGGNTKSFCCYQVFYLAGAKFTSATQIKEGDEVVVCARLINYMGNTPETVGKGDGRIVKHNDESEPEAEDVVTTKVADVNAAAVNANVTLSGAVVVAAGTKGFVVTDSEGKDFIYAYNEKAATPAVGSVVTIKGVRKDYNEMPELGVSEITKTGDASVSHPAVKDITESIDSYTSTAVEYVKFTGTLAKNDKYYNVTIEGKSVQGSIENPAQDLTSFIGVPSTFAGYRIFNTAQSSTGKKFVNIILTEAAPSGEDFFQVSPLSTSVSSKAGTTTINVNSNVAWTAVSDNAAFTINPASGTGAGTITVTYTANEATESRTAKVTVATTAEVSTKSYEVVITQGAVVAGASYQKVTAALTDWRGKYLIAHDKDIFMDGALPGGKDSGCIGAANAKATPGEALSSDGLTVDAEWGDAHHLEIVAVDDNDLSKGYYLKTSNATNSFIYHSANTNGISGTANQNTYSKYPMFIEFVSANEINIFPWTNGAKIGCALRYNPDKSGNMFRFYKSNDGVLTQDPVYLYKYTE